VAEQFYYTDATIPASTPEDQLQFTSGEAPGTAAVSLTFINADSDADVFRAGRCRNNLIVRCGPGLATCPGGAECLNDVITAFPVGSIEQEVHCSDGGGCAIDEICSGVIPGVPLSGTCVPAP
jgi:hypothetical protein